MLKGKSLSVDLLLLPWQHFLGGTLQEDRVLQNSNDVTVVISQSILTKFVILLEILRFIFVSNLSKIGLLMFPWQHIFELALMQNQPIQLSNDVTVTLFLN